MFDKNKIIAFINFYLIINYKLIISVINWLYWNYFLSIFLKYYNIQLSFYKFNAFKEFYFISSLFQHKLEKSYLNYDLNRLNVFNFWAEEYFVTQTPLMAQT